MRQQIEEGNYGKIVAIAIETGAFELADDTMTATRRLYERTYDGMVIWDGSTKESRLMRQTNIFRDRSVRLCQSKRVLFYSKSGGGRAVPFSFPRGRKVPQCSDRTQLKWMSKMDERVLKLEQIKK